MEYNELLQRYVGRMVCVSTFGHVKLWGKLEEVTEDCLRLVNTMFSNEGDDQWLSQHTYSDPDSSYGNRNPESIVHFHHVVAITCVDDDLPPTTNQTVNQAETIPDTNVGRATSTAISALFPRTPVTENNDTPLADAVNFQVERMEIQLGTDLIALCRPDDGKDLTNRIHFMRNLLFQDLGFVFPRIRVRDNAALQSEEYRMFLQGCEIGRGIIRKDKILALLGPEVTKELAGEPVMEPAYAEPAIWIDVSERAHADKLGYFTVEPVTVLVTHLQKELRHHAASLFTLDNLRNLLEQVKTFAPCAVEETVPARIAIPKLHAICCRLLEEEVSLRPFDLILEKLSHLEDYSNNIEVVSQLRLSIGRHICERFREREGSIPVLTLEHAFHDLLEHLLLDDDVSTEDRLLIPEYLEKLREILSEYRNPTTNRMIPLVVEQHLRRRLWEMLSQIAPSVAVLAIGEMVNDFSINLVESVTLERVHRMPLHDESPPPKKKNTGKRKKTTTSNTKPVPR
jgi:flagellar biosynthesis component FlhA